MVSPLFINQICRIRSASLSNLDGKICDLNARGPAEICLELYEQFGLNYPKFLKMDPLSKMGFIASESILRTNPIPEDDLKSTAIVLSNDASSLDVDGKYFETVGHFASPALFVYTLPNVVIGEICIRNRFKGENAFFVQDKFDAEWIADYVEGLMMHQGVSNCLAGWIEVRGEHYDVFLYLTQKHKGTSGREHSFQTIQALYQG